MKDRSTLIQLMVVVLFGLSVFFLGFYLSKKSTKEAGVSTATQTDTTSTIPSLSLEEIAVSVGLKASEFAVCIELPEIAARVDAQEEAGVKIGVSGTPGTFIWDTQTGIAKELGGAVPYETLKADFESVKKGEGTKVALGAITSDDYVRGSTSARYVLMEWSDYDCPYCKSFHETAKQLLTEFPNDLKWVYRQYPLSFHPTARSKSIGALCAGKLGGSDTFWNFSDMLMAQTE